MAASLRRVLSRPSPLRNLQSWNHVRASSSAKPAVDFSDTKAAFQAKSTTELLTGMLVFSLCKVRPLVERAEPLLKLSYKLLGSGATNLLLRKTFFGHFCAGEDEETIRPVIHKLEKHGVGSILDYAAENDIATESNEIAIPASTTEGKVKARVYDYQSEKVCDEHMNTFERAIKSVHNVSPTGFAAIKCTALGNPELLRRVSVTLTQLRALFKKLDVDNNGVVSREEFLKTFSTKIAGKDVLSYFDNLDADKDGFVDYIEWTNGLRIEELHFLTAHCTVAGPLAASVLTEEELELLKRMKARVFHLAALARELGVRIMIDAEHSYFQPAIDHLTVELSRKYNTASSFPVIFSTYQLYLNDSMDRLLTDMDRARKGGYKFAAKLVRGAYMVIERQHALENNIPDPVRATIQDTHKGYNAAVRETINRIARGDQVEIMIATHNQESVEAAVQCMKEHNLPPSNSGVYFGQLLGMADHLTFCLAGSGYKSYKYVPYGRVREVMPYLIRRAQENSDALSGASLALSMSRKELKRRLF